ncbi:MAG: hypothetical protein S0880_15620 [Actinomycetota bacterium]|nr:hypothetical protein [Actinomycetota bacterium]
METRRWTNPSQPQTLQIAVFLLYFHAVLGLIGFSSNFWGYALGWFIGTAALVAYAAAGYGIANERKWAYNLGVVATAGEVILMVAVVGIMNLLSSLFIITFMFSIARAALLLHPMSRDYQRIWFK